MCEKSNKNKMHFGAWLSIETIFSCLFLCATTYFVSNHILNNSIAAHPPTGEDPYMGISIGNDYERLIITTVSLFSFIFFALFKSIYFNRFLLINRKATLIFSTISIIIIILWNFSYKKYEVPDDLLGMFSISIFSSSENKRLSLYISCYFLIATLFDRVFVVACRSNYRKTAERRNVLRINNTDIWKLFYTTLMTVSMWISAIFIGVYT